jgi:SAM-dependent methyltransferase
MDDYFSGARLYGDDFGLAEIAQWYEDEKEGYARLGDKSRSSYRYEYHALNQLHGFRFIGQGRFGAALGLGSAFGDEFLPIANRIDHITVVEPSDAFGTGSIGGVPCDYVKPLIDGRMPFKDGRFDLVLCLGVLHHIPNVTTVLEELYRCLSPGGYLLLREPIVSMGDWTKPRPSATKRERGIPLDIIRNIVVNAGFHVRHEGLCVFPGVRKLCIPLRVHPYNSVVATRIDAVLCRLLRCNIRYHATRALHKMRPTSVYFVLLK